ncbi:CinA family protein [Jiangella asiatica]|uniref:CinA family protein n=1 Tax=Jiangella asiatica TaxID=2530372 RepID=A0A4R5DJ98_9ACTN|nr:CinA family protein [Jiangella asiatica]TDE14039.1 CinA family protein [Jiangella asiatica]
MNAAAADAVRSLAAAGLTVATAESLTGGLVCAVLTSVPGSSAVVRGGVVVYATELKASLAGVPDDLLDRLGPVGAEVAAAMARGVRSRLGADVGVATTGVAGPDGQDGHPPGTVHVAVASPAGTTLRSYAGDDVLPGGRAEVRDATVRAALELLSEL